MRFLRERTLAFVGERTLRFVGERTLRFQSRTLEFDSEFLEN